VGLKTLANACAFDLRANQRTNRQTISRATAATTWGFENKAQKRSKNSNILRQVG